MRISGSSRAFRQARRLTWAVLGLGAAFAPARAGLQNSDWPMFHRNAMHEARSFEAIPSAPVIAWSHALTDSAAFCSPVVDVAGNVYIGDVGKDLWSIGPAGNLRWTFHAGGNFRRSTPAINADGTIYIGGADNKLYAINPNGTLKWTFLAGGPVKTSPAVATNGTIYFGADDGKLYSVTPNGLLNWAYQTGGAVRSSPAILNDVRIVFGSNDGSVYALNTNGTLAWEGVTGGPIKAAPAIGQGNDVIVASQDGFLYAIGVTGVLDWAVFTGNTLRSSPAIGVTGKIYLGNANEISCFHDDGDLSWSYPTGGDIESSPAVYTAPSDSTETVIVGSNDGNVYAIREGVLLWRRTIGSAIYSSPAISDGRVLVGGNDGFLYAFGAATAGVPEAATGSYRLQVGPSPLLVGQSLQIQLSGGEPGTQGEVVFYSASGRELDRLNLETGHSTTWGGHDKRGRALDSGVYFYTSKVGAERFSGSVVIIR